MGNVACIYGKLGRYKDALVMQTKALELGRRLLPENHPIIGAVNLRLIDQGGG
jgi:hypothetical protein